MECVLSKHILKTVLISTALRIRDFGIRDFDIERPEDTGFRDTGTSGYWIFGRREAHEHVGSGRHDCRPLPSIRNRSSPQPPILLEDELLEVPAAVEPGSIEPEESEPMVFGADELELDEVGVDVVGVDELEAPAPAGVFALAPLQLPSAPEAAIDWFCAAIASPKWVSNTGRAAAARAVTLESRPAEASS
jgi:hypothetical protein